MAIRYSTGLRNKLMDTGSFKSQMEGSAGFLIDLYSGSRPASPDTAATGTKLLTLSVSGGGTGLHFEDAASDGVIEKAAAEAWSGIGLAGGTAGYYRMRLTTDTGTSDSTTALRVDGTVGTSGADMNMTSTTVATGAPFSVATAEFTMPASAA